MPSGAEKDFTDGHSFGSANARVCAALQPARQHTAIGAAAARDHGRPARNGIAESQNRGLPEHESSKP
jgi:hypothetical protein